MTTNRLPGAVEEPEDPSAKKHVWERDWLNNSDGSATCKICGASKLGQALIRADRVRGNGKQMNHYRDAHGNVVSTFEELSCPIYLGDPGSAAATAKEHVRRVKGQVNGVEKRVGGVEGRMESVEERLVRLETDNANLREELAQAREVDVTRMFEWFMELAQQAKAGQIEPERISLRGHVVDVPRQIAEVIDVVGDVVEPEREKVPVGRALDDE